MPKTPLTKHEHPFLFFIFTCYGNVHQMDQLFTAAIAFSLDNEWLPIPLELHLICGNSIITKCQAFVVSFFHCYSKIPKRCCKAVKRSLIGHMVLTKHFNYQVNSNLSVAQWLCINVTCILTCLAYLRTASPCDASELDRIYTFYCMPPSTCDQCLQLDNSHIMDHIMDHIMSFLFICFMFGTHTQTHTHHTHTHTHTDTHLSVTFLQAVNVAIKYITKYSQ